MGWQKSCAPVKFLHQFCIPEWIQIIIGDFLSFSEASDPGAPLLNVFITRTNPAAKFRGALCSEISVFRVRFTSRGEQIQGQRLT